MPARSATSSRRRPFTLRRVPPTGRPASAGETRSRRELRNSRTAVLAASLSSMPPRVRAARTRRGSRRVPLPAGPAPAAGNGVLWVSAIEADGARRQRARLAAAEEEREMSDTKVVLVTGAGRGMGVDIARAALGAGLRVVATARDAQKVTEALGEHENLLAVGLDVTDPAGVQAAVDVTVERFGRIDVLINNAGNFYAGFFEEITPDDFRAQVETNLFGTLDITRAALPVLRAQRSGVVVTITSTAGLVGGEFCTAYAASKFALEGWMESLAPEVAPFGISTMVVEPGFFRTDLLTPESTSYAKSSIEDYAPRTEQTVAAWDGMNGQQGGDPAKLAQALIGLATSEQPPVRWVAGADAVAAVEQKAKDLLAQVDAHREISSSLALDA